MEPIKIMQSFVITSYFITFTFSYEGIAYRTMYGGYFGI